MNKYVLILGILIMFSVNVNSGPYEGLGTEQIYIDVLTDEETGLPDYRMNNNTVQYGFKFSPNSSFLLINITPIRMGLSGNPQIRCQIYTGDAYPVTWLANSSNYLHTPVNSYNCSFDNTPLTKNLLYWLTFKCDDCDAVTYGEFTLSNTTYTPAYQGRSADGITWTIREDLTMGIPTSQTNITFYGVEVPYTLSGRVLDGETLQPIITLPQVVLKQGATSYSDICDIDGFYSVTGLNAGEYNYTYSELPGYISVTGSITIDEDETKDVVLFSTDFDGSTSTQRLSFLNEDSSPFVNETIRFTYDSGTCGGGCTSLIGTEYLFTTDSEGKIDVSLANGEYIIDKIGYQIKRDFFDEYGDFVYYQFYADNAQTFWLIGTAELHNVTIVAIDSSTGDGILNATVSLASGGYFYWNYTSSGGDVNFTMVDRSYNLIIRHDDYHNYPSLEHYGIDTRTIHTSPGYIEYILLIPIAKTEFSIYGNITTVNYSKHINATVMIDGNGTFIRQENTAFYNFTNLTSNNNYRIRAVKDGFFDTPEFLVWLLSDTRLDIAMENISEEAVLTLWIDERNDLPNVRAELTDVTNALSYGTVIVYTNTTGGGEFTGIIKNHNYKLVLSRGGYKSNTTHISFNEVNRTINFSLEIIISTFTFNGYVYRQGSSPPYGVKGAKLSIYGTANNYETYTDSTGYFEITGIVYDDYILNLTKLGYFSRLFMPLAIYGDTFREYYLIIEEDVIATGFRILNNQSLGIEGAAIRIYTQETEDVISTDNTGYAEINLPAGKYSLEIVRDGYQTLNTDILVATNGQIFEFQLLRFIPRVSHPFGETDFFGFVQEFGWVFMLISFTMFMFLVLVTLYRGIVKG